MIPLIVIACIILFFVFLFTVHAYITIEMVDDMALTIRVLGIPIKILPKKPKTYNIKKYTLKKIRKREAKAAQKAAKAAENKKKKKAAKAQKQAEKKAELAKLSKEELRERKEKKKAGRPALTDLIPLACNTLGLFFSRFFGKLHIKVAMLHVRVGAADAMQAAVIYGVANQAVQYFMEFLKKICHVDGLKKADISIEPDFLSDKIEFECKVTVRVSIGNVLGALFKAGWHFLVGFIKIKPDPNHPKGIKPPKPPKAPKAPRPDPIPTPDQPEARA
jgi:hypothetical protein